MRWVAIFSDQPQMVEFRRRHHAEHLAYLAQHADEILLAGGLRDNEEDSASYVGGLWVMEVSSRARAVDLVEGDPYYQSRYRRYQLSLWGRAFERAVTL